MFGVVRGAGRNMYRVDQDADGMTHRLVGLTRVSSLPGQTHSLSGYRGVTQCLAMSANGILKRG